MSVFGNGLEGGYDGLDAETDDYLKAKFAKAKVASGKKKAKAKPRPKPPAPAAVIPEPRSQAEEELEAERELLGLLPKETCQEASPPTRVAQADSQEVRLDENRSNAEAAVDQRVLGQLAATRLATPGSEHKTCRTCLEGHPLQCYIVGWSAALCDHCDLMQKPGQVVFGCQECECEMCVGCVLSTAPSEEAAEEDLRVITRVAQNAKPGITRFVATPTGAVLDTSPLAAPVRQAAAPALEPSAEEAAVPAPSKEAAQAAEAAEEPAPAGPPAEFDPTVLCPKGKGECLMFWTSRAKYREYYCSGCHFGPKKGARWHCALHREDFCEECRPAPPDAAATRGVNDIDDSSWKRGGRAAAPARGDLLSKMIAEQEQMIQDCGLWVRESKEAAERSRAVRPTPRKPPAAAAPPTPPPTPDASARESQGAADGDVASEAIDFNLMDENAARTRPQWAVEGAERPQRPRDAPLERTFDLTLTLVGDFVDELARGYSQPWYQELVQECARECDYDRKEFLMRLQDVAFEVQRPILENWGFDGDEQGVFDMTSILREHSQGAPPWLQERVDRCLALLYGGDAAGMLV